VARVAPFNAHYRPYEAWFRRHTIAAAGCGASGCAGGRGTFCCDAPRVFEGRWCVKNEGIRLFEDWMRADKR